MTGHTDVVIGVDIGGTNTALGFVDESGNCLVETSFPTNAREPADVFVPRLHEQIERLNKSVPGIILKGIGIGAPNGNYYRGTVENTPNLSWKGVVPLAAMVNELYNVPVAITNDANAAALGEMKFGAAKGMKDFIVITLGTGLGSGIVVNGEVVYGSTGFAGEIGHTIVDPNGRQCGCGRKGCLETYASATGIRTTVKELLGKSDRQSELRNIPAEDLSAKQIADAAQRGDALAREAFEFTGKILGFKLADSVAHTSPEAIILFGGLAAAGELIFEPTRRHLESNLLNIFQGTVKLLPSQLQERNAAVLGASALVWTR
ncbi:MAG: ROK family protein [bacterium]